MAASVVQSSLSSTLEGFSSSLSATPTDLINSLVSSTMPATSSMSSDDASSNSTSADDTGTIDATMTSNLPVQITNAISLAACLIVVVSYFWFRRKNQRIMERPSLILAVSMAMADLLLHAINEFGYTDLPHNFICSFFGGFLYAFPTLISIFYSFCIALNTQLVFVFSKRPGNSTLKYYIGVPIALAGSLCIPALAAGVYGYDPTEDVCWIASDGTQDPHVLVRYLLTFGIWCLAVMAYLMVAAATIIYAVFSKSSKINQLASGLSKSLASSSGTPNNAPTSAGRPATRYSTYYPNLDVANTQAWGQASEYSNQQQDPAGAVTSLKSEFEDEPPTPVTASRRARISKRFTASMTGNISGSGSNPHSNVAHNNTTLSRRSLAMRALAWRLIGYILIPTVCILPGVIIDLITKVSPDTAANIPDSVSTAFDTINGLVGLFNAILYAMDPALLALYHQIRMARREKQGISGGHGEDVEMATTARPGVSVYSTPPESPGPDTPSSWGHHAGGSQAEKHGEDGSLGVDGQSYGADTKSKAELPMGTETKVEVRSGRFLSPILTGGRSRRANLGLPSPRTARNARTPGGMGIVIRVEVQVNDDQDQELARLERYLGGL